MRTGTLSMPIVSYLIEYLGKFKLKFETISDYESGDQMGSSDAKEPPSKISCLGTFNEDDRVAKLKSRRGKNIKDFLLGVDMFNNGQ
jgi:hypothetical protein